MVDHSILLSKLIVYGLCDNTTKWFNSYLSDRQQFVCIAGKNSDFDNVPHGVPQGSILEPLLFIIFINDLPLYTQSTGAEIDLYADDNILTATADISAIGKIKVSRVDW